MTTGTLATDTAPNAGLGRLYYLEFTIPAGTPQSAPVSQSWPLEDNNLVSISTRIPPGPSGLMGFRIMWAEQQIVPWGNNSWLICDDEELNWPSNTAVTLTGLVVQGYNTGTYPHTVYLRALITTLSATLQQEVNTETGIVALPASQAGPLSGEISNYVAPLPDETGMEETPETESAPVEPIAPEINPSISLVAVS
jgi:hypothetical protein